MARNNSAAAAVQGKVYYPRARFFSGPGDIQHPTVPATDEIPWLIGIETRKSMWATSDRFRATFSLFGDKNFSYEYWGNVPGMTVDIQLAFDEATPQGRVLFRDWTSIFRGVADKIEQDCVKGIVTVTGRDLGGVFNSSMQTAAYQEADIAETLTALAAKYGFKTEIGGEFAGTFGRNYNDEKSHQSLGMASRQVNDRDMIEWLNTHRGGTWWMDGDTLHCAVNPEGDVWEIDCFPPDFLPGAARHKPANFTNLRFEHNLEFTIQHQVVGIRTAGNEKVGEKIPFPPNAAVGEDFQHLMSVDGKNTEDAKTFIEGQYHEYIGREWLVEWETSDPTLIDMHPTDTLFVNGPLGNGGKYFMDFFEHHCDSRRGYRCIVHGKIGRDAE